MSLCGNRSEALIPLHHISEPANDRELSCQITEGPSPQTCKVAGAEEVASKVWDSS